jgi:hypothetical protein
MGTSSHRASGHPVPNEVKKAADHLSIFAHPSLKTHPKEWGRIENMRQEEWEKKDWRLHRVPLLVQPIKLTTQDLLSFYREPLNCKNAQGYSSAYVDFNQHLASLLIVTSHSFSEYLLGRKWCPVSKKTISAPQLEAPDSTETQSAAQGLADVLRLFVQEPFVHSINSDNARHFADLFQHLSIHIDRTDQKKIRPFLPKPPSPT